MNARHAYGAIVLMGVSGCGKSTVGHLLAANLECAFIEGDDLHSPDNIAKMKTGTALTDEDRWPWLDRIGQAIQIEATNQGTVVATCSALTKRYRDRLTRAVSAPLSFVLLDGSPSMLLARLRARSDHFMPASLLASQLDTLERPTRSERALTLDAELDPAELCQSILTWLSRTI